MLNNDVRIELGHDALLPALCEGFNTGFADYKYGVRMDEPQMARFLARSGISLEHSAILLQRNGAGWHGAGVALIAVEDGEAWCSGLAVAPVLRGQGFGRRLMEVVHIRAQVAGAHTLWLEVLANNSTARALYESLGYQARRSLLYWRAESPPDHGYDQGDLQPAAVDNALASAYDWQQASPAWQRSQRAVVRYRDELRAYRMQDREGAAGWAVTLPTTSSDPARPRQRIMTLAVRPGEQREMLASQLLGSLRATHPDTRFSLVNEPEESIFTPVLPANGFVEVDRQVEMFLRLDPRTG